MKYLGSCHCNAVSIEIEAPAKITVQDCNCSMCRKSGHLHLIVPQQNFHLLGGSNALTLYQFNTNTARHYFCKHCGIKVFYVPRSNPDGYSVNVRCLEPEPDMTIESFDGQNWEANAAALKHLTGDP